MILRRLLEVLNQENGGARVLDLLSEPATRALVGTVNLSEAQAVLIRRGMPDEEAWRLLSEFDLEIISFDAGQARSAGALIARTSKQGLSFGDRACLALAMQEKCGAISADRAWKKLNIAIQVELVRN